MIISYASEFTGFYCTIWQYGTVWDNNEIIRMRHDATRHNATRKPCALTLRSRRAIRDSNEAPPALLAPEPVEPGRLKTGRSWKILEETDLKMAKHNETQNGRIEMKRIEKRLEMTWDLRSSKFEAEYFRKKVSESRTLRRYAQVIFASDSSWDFDTSDRPKKSFFLVFAIWVAAHQLVALRKHSWIPTPSDKTLFQTRKTLAAQPIAFAHLRALSRHVQTPNPIKIKPGSWSHGHSAKLSFCAEKRTDWISKISIIFNKRRLWALIIC